MTLAESNGWATLVGYMKSTSLDAFNRRVKKRVRRAEIREAADRFVSDEPLPGDDKLIHEGALRDTKLWVSQHFREERKYAKQPPEERIRYDLGEKRFYRERPEVYPTSSGGYERRLVRNYIETSHEPEYIHAMMQAVSEFVTDEEESQRIIKDWLADEESSSVKAAMSALGAVGGKVKSEAKARAARENGKRGGRRKKLP